MWLGIRLKLAGASRHLATEDSSQSKPERKANHEQTKNQIRNGKVGHLEQPGKLRVGSGHRRPGWHQGHGFGGTKLLPRPPIFAGGRTCGANNGTVNQIETMKIKTRHILGEAENEFDTDRIFIAK